MNWLLSRARGRREQRAEERVGVPRFGWLALEASPTRADLGFSLLVGILLAASPITGGTRIIPSIVLGAVGAAGVLLMRMRKPRSSETEWRRFTIARPSLTDAVLFAVAALVFAPTLAWLYQRYTDAIWQNGHGLFVPLFMALLARHTLRRDASPLEESSAWGFALLVPGLALTVLDVGIGSHYLDAVGLVLVLPGLSLLLLGARRTRAIALPLVLGVFLIPLPTSLERFVWLSEASAALASHLLHAFHYPVIFTQTLARLDEARSVSITQNCSGASTLYAGMALATMAAATARSRARRWPPLLALYPALVIANGLRCFMVILLVWYGGMNALHTPLHGSSGIAVFAGVLLVLWLCSDRQGLREALS